MEIHELYIPSSSGLANLHCVEWIPDGEVKAIVQIAQQNEEACDIIGKAEFGRAYHRLKRPDGTGAGGRRAGIAVQSRHADGFPRPLIQSSLEEIRQVQVGQ